MIKQFGFPYEEKYQEEIEAKLAIDAYHTATILGIAILIMQTMMILLFMMKPGGPFATARRTGYFSLYLLLLIITMCFLIIRNHKKNAGGAVQLRIEVIYAVVLCWWACAVTALDQIGGNGLIVFSYIMMGTAALTILNLQQSILIFGSGFVLLNMILPFFPEGVHNLFSNLVNSFFITMMCIMIARRLYLARTSAHYSNIIIQQQYAEIEEKNQQLREIAVTDQLTALPNRRYLEEVLLQRLQGLEGQMTSVAGLMLDIDFFKDYNDRYGHLAGDDCLRRVADEIRNFANIKDMYAVRFGGEEFFICWLHCDRDTALAGAQRLVQQIADHSPHWNRLEHMKVTVSIGVCVQVPWNQTDLDTLVQRADLALYEAKASGRNQAVLYQPIMKFCQIKNIDEEINLK